MRPWQHARSSAGKDWGADLPVHEFLDSTKWACADRRHRAVLHHVDLGAEITARVFPDTPQIPRIVAQHVTEDLGHPATLADWFACCDPGRLPRPVERRIAGGPKGVAAILRLPDATRGAAEEVCQFLFRPGDLHPGALPLLMNSVGPMIVRRVFGPPRQLPDGQVIDFGYIAEAAIFTSFGRIPDLGEVVRVWNSEPVEPR